MSNAPIFVVTGGRDLTGHKWRALVDAALDSEMDLVGLPSKLWHGNADGIDTLCDQWAERFGVSARVFEADWEQYGKAAGPRRNQEMIDDAAQKVRDGVHVVFIAFPGGKGTRDCLRRAERAGLRIRRWMMVGDAFQVTGTPQGIAA